MKKQEESQPIDDLFARKLGNLSLSPGADGFERLQARMGQGKTEARVIIWRNPAVQRYMAIAACLLLVGLFGWLYLRTDSGSTTGRQQVAGQLNKPKQPIRELNGNEADNIVPRVKQEKQQVQKNIASQLATIDKPVVAFREHTHPSKGVSPIGKSASKSVIVSRNEQPAVAQIAAADNKNNTIATTPSEVTTTNSVKIERLAENTTKPSIPTERVLTVTIDEPASLIAARQAVKMAVEERTTIAINDEPSQKETKSGGLWQQVKRVRQGELFARRDNPKNDDRGLLGRAYSGLKQSFEKDKSEK